MADDARILLTSETPDRPRDLFGYHTPSGQRLRMSQPRIITPGLRFIKQNVPHVEILEFPSWDEYVRVLDRGWDIVGFSFFSDGTDAVLRMAEHARDRGIPELWAGNYGALNPLIESSFDRVFLGYAEEQVAAHLGRPTAELVHPPIIDGMGIEPFGGSFLKVGWLYTARGCPLKCSFCQTPSFAPTLAETPLSSIDRVLDYYNKHGVQLVIILDEIFGLSRAHANGVAGLLAKHELPWIVMTRSDIVRANLDEWDEAGLAGVIIGVESMNQSTLDGIQKRLKLETTVEVMAELRRRHIMIFPTYMIGFESDTVDSVKRDLEQLRQLRPDFVKLFFVTPYPMTPLWDEIETRYGIDTSDWSLFDGKHLVWNHPNLSREDAQELLEYGYMQFNTPEYVGRFVSNMIHRVLRRRGPASTHSFFLSNLHNRIGKAFAGVPGYFQ